MMTAGTKISKSRWRNPVASINGIMQEKKKMLKK